MVNGLILMYLTGLRNLVVGVREFLVICWLVIFVRSRNACVRCCGYVIMERMLRITVLMKSFSPRHKWGKSRSRIKALRQSIHRLQVEEKE